MCEVPSLLDAGKYAELTEIAERLIEAVVHCVDPSPVVNAEDARIDDYRLEVLICGLWILSLAGDRPPPAVHGDCKKIGVLCVDADMNDADANSAAIDWVLTEGANVIDPDVYNLAVGRALATMAHTTVQTYVNTFVVPTNTQHGVYARQLAKILVNMAKNCSWKRTKDLHLFQHVRAKLHPARLAPIVFGENPMGAITAQLEDRITNKVIGSHITADVARQLSVAPWKHCTSTEIFITCVTMLQENMDCEVCCACMYWIWFAVLTGGVPQVPLFINTEIPYHRTVNVPSFVLLTGTFATRGTRFGVVWNQKMTFVKSDTAYPILETILIWLALCRDKAVSATHNMLHEAIEEPDRTMQTNKFHKFVH